MRFPWPAAIAAGMFAVCAPRAARGQLDYRNLDDDRPSRVEDAYPVEWRAVEINLPYAFTRFSDGSRLHASALELTWGALRDAQLGIKVPLAGLDAPGPGARTFSVSGIRLFGLYNFNTDAPLLPALSLRGDVQLPAGALGGTAARGGIAAIATRSFGRTRVHVNAAVGFGADGRAAAVEQIADRWIGAAIDHTLVRSSVLLVAELHAVRERMGEPTELNAGGGLRIQGSPTTVLDIGLTRRLRRDGPDLGFTIGLAHSFAVRALMGGSPPHSLETGEQHAH